MPVIAAAAYPLSPLAGWAGYEEKLARWVEEAVDGGAELLVFPEYGGAELAAFGGVRWGDDDFGAVDAITSRFERAHAFLAKLARARGVHILSGSAPIREGGRILNRAYFIGPEGGMAAVDKLMPTRWEREALGMAGGAEAKAFDTALGRIGVAICYDSEFPLIARAIAEAGAELLLVPSCTETEAGYWRVRVGAMARALENQFWTVQAPLIGDNDWAGMVETNTGAAGVYGPPDAGFPPTGVASAGERDEPGWLIREIDLSAVARVRAEGGVQNHLNWPEQLDGRFAKAVPAPLR